MTKTEVFTGGDMISWQLMDGTLLKRGLPGVEIVEERFEKKLGKGIIEVTFRWFVNMSEDKLRAL